MANPTTIARLDPSAVSAIYLEDGYATIIGLQNLPSIKFWEKTATPPSVDGGDAIDTTTMHNDTWKTKASQDLLELGPTTSTVSYDPAVYDQVIAQINVEQSITVLFPDLSTLDFFGFLRAFEPAESSIGSQPEATVTFEATNWDPANDVESQPVMTEVAGT